MEVRAYYDILYTELAIVSFYFTLDISVGAVCVYPNRVSDSVRSLKEAGAVNIPIASGIYSVYKYCYLRPTLLHATEVIRETTRCLVYRFINK